MVTQQGGFTEEVTLRLEFKKLNRIFSNTQVALISHNLKAIVKLIHPQAQSLHTVNFPHHQWSSFFVRTLINKQDSRTMVVVLWVFVD